MLTLLTGQPGAGKTLRMIQEVKEYSEREKRPVFYAGINGLSESLGWILLDSKKDWHKAPDGAIVVIDECQEMWRTRGIGAQVPEYVSAMETHRHRGLDVFVTTQHPMLLDTNIRRLVGRHLHVVRAFGMQKAVIHEWQSLKAEPEKSKADSVRHDWAYPKDVFSLYKSSELHTHKRRIPARYFFMFLAPFLIIGFVWYAATLLYKRSQPAAPVAAAQPAVASGQVGNRTLTSAEWLKSREPRVPDLAYSAPVYDAVTAPVRAPFPAMAISLGGRCLVYSQQGTSLPVSKAVCEQLLKSPAFRDFDDAPPVGGSPVRSEPVVSPVLKPDASASAAAISHLGASPWPVGKGSGEGF